MFASTLKSTSNFYIVFMVTNAIEKNESGPTLCICVCIIYWHNAKAGTKFDIDAKCDMFDCTWICIETRNWNFFHENTGYIHENQWKKSYLVSICALVCSHCARAWLTANCAFLSSALAMLGNFCSKNSLGNQTMWPTNVMPGIWK